MKSSDVGQALHKKKPVRDLFWMLRSCLEVFRSILQVCCVAITDGRANVPSAVRQGDQNALD